MENPWGEPSPPLASAAPSSSPDPRDSTESHADVDAERAPTRLSLELVDEDDDAPAWDARDDDDNDDADDAAWAKEARASMLKVNDMTLSEQATEGDQARDAAGRATFSDHGDEEEEDTTQIAEPPAAPAPPIPIVPPALPDFDIDAGQQQMDDFPEDGDGGGGGGGDEFDDFGDATEAAAGGDDDDFGDFGDFGDAAPLDEAAFEAAPPPATTTTPLPSTSLASASHFPSHQPFASTSAAASVSYPPLHFDLSGDPSRQSISSQLHDFWQGAFPTAAAANAVSDEPERQVEGVAQVLVSESSRSLWSELSTLPPLRPVDWRRSRIRREHLISMGFPVSQEEEAPLPSMTAQTSPNPAFPIPARPSSAPPPASSAALSSSQNGLGRPSTPLGTTTTAARGSGITSSSVNRSLGGLGGLAPAQPPPFDRERAEQALAASSNEADLSLRSLDELRQLDAELDRISVEASELLTFALMMREKETQDKEVYNGMIQDLVIAAAKMKTSSAISSGAGKEPKRSGSGRWKLSK